MPELPEVETIRVQASVVLVHEQFVEISQNEYGVLRGDTKYIVGQEIVGVRRFGKLLVFDFLGGYSMSVHLKMTGRLTLLQAGLPEPTHLHVRFKLSNQQELVFSDVRRFGYLQILPTNKITSLPFVMHLGPEPLKDLTLAALQSLFAKSKRPIKTLLLDQTKIAGIGNIYASECLWIAEVHPERLASSLSKTETQALFEAIETVLAEGIARGGASDNDYRNLLGGKGEYQNFFKVYRRTGKPCLRCSEKIAMLRLAGRSSFYCPNCQKL